MLKVFIYRDFKNPPDWWCQSSEYKPPLDKRDSWSPSSTISPLSRTSIRSICAIVDNLWAMAITVFPFIIFFKVSWIWVSISLSRALVASSKSRIGAFFRITRANVIRWRCPPDNLIPRSPTWASYPFRPYSSCRFKIKSWACAFFAAAMISRSVAFDFP